MASHSRRMFLPSVPKCFKSSVSSRLSGQNSEFLISLMHAICRIRQHYQGGLTLIMVTLALHSKTNEQFWIWPSSSITTQVCAWDLHNLSQSAIMLQLSTEKRVSARREKKSCFKYGMCYLWSEVHMQHDITTEQTCTHVPSGQGQCSTQLACCRSCCRFH
jgi:hypothetical protein